MPMFTKLLQAVSAALAILVGPMSGSILWAESQKRPESEIDGDTQAKRAHRTALNSASTRTTSSAASSPSQHGIITSGPGPINPGPRSNPSSVSGEVLGSDETRSDRYLFVWAG